MCFCPGSTRSCPSPKIGGQTVDETLSEPLFYYVFLCSPVFRGPSAAGRRARSGGTRTKTLRSTLLTRVKCGQDQRDCPHTLYRATLAPKHRISRRFHYRTAPRLCGKLKQTNVSSFYSQCHEKERKMRLLLLPEEMAVAKIICKDLHFPTKMKT